MMEQFEAIKQTFGNVYVRSAQALCKELKCCEYTDFLNYINASIQSCTDNDYDSGLHFTATPEDYHLSQYACYLIVSRLPFSDEELKRKVKKYFYTKDFEGRNKDKQKLDGGEYEPLNIKYINEKEIWNCKIGINVGNESNGKGKYLRPVLILRRIGSIYLVVPLTKNGKEAPDPMARYYYKIQSIDFGFSSYLMLSQIRVIDKKRCFKNMGTISEEEFRYIKNLLRDMYLPEDSL